MNTFFVNVGPSVTAEVTNRGPAPDIPVRMPRVGACAFTLQPIRLEHLCNIVFSMRNSSACGADGLCIRVLKMAFHVIGSTLLHIVNACLTLNDVPSVWKHALVHPIFKAGDPVNPSNYRPISILPVMAKIVEKVVQHQLYSYLSKNHLLAPTRSGNNPWLTRH